MAIVCRRMPALINTFQTSKRLKVDNHKPRVDKLHWARLHGTEQ